VLPDGMISNQKCEFEKFLECLAMKDDGKFQGHFVFFITI
jgi:hypothetical protein